MHFLFGLVLIALVIMWLWVTIALIGLLIRLACYLIVLLFLLAWLPIAAGVDLYRYVKRRRMASAVNLDAVTVASEQEPAEKPAVTLTQNSNGVWRPRT
jgi:hypothetical protein